ncbi:hypothetical protein ACVBEG_13755 [Pseudomonas sp. GG8]
MLDCIVLEKGSISFRVRKTVVAIILVRYCKPNKVIKSVLLDQIDEESAVVLDMLSSYRRGQEKWHEFVASKLPGIRRKREESARKMSYEEISKALIDIVWSLKKHREQDRTGRQGGREVAIGIWQAWQDIRPIISSTTYWGVKEDEAKAALGLTSKNSSLNPVK